MREISSRLHRTFFLFGLFSGNRNIFSFIVIEGIAKKAFYGQISYERNLVEKIVNLYVGLRRLLHERVWGFCFSVGVKNVRIFGKGFLE